MQSSRIVHNRYFSRNPFFIVLYVTSRCNAYCKMCYNWKNIANAGNRIELSLNEIGKIASHIQSVQQLTISGGEPFLREDLAEICTLFCKKSNVQFITIPTNGLLTDCIERILKKALTDNPYVHFRIGLSMPEVDDELDELLGVKNAYKKHRETFEMFRALKKIYKNLNVDIGIVCNKYNIDRVRYIVDRVVSEKEECNPIVSMVRGKPRFKEAKDIPIDELDYIYTYCKERIPKINNRPFADFMNQMTDMVHNITIKTVKEKKMILPCKCGIKLIVIYDNGDVYPCELLDENLGNLRDHDYDIHKVLNLNTSRIITKKIRDSKCYCTWECALNNNIIFSYKYVFELFLRYISYKTGWFRLSPKTGQYDKL